MHSSASLSLFSSPHLVSPHLIPIPVASPLPPVKSPPHPGPPPPYLVCLLAALLIQLDELVLTRAGLDAKVEAETGRISKQDVARRAITHRVNTSFRQLLKRAAARSSMTAMAASGHKTTRTPHQPAPGLTLVASLLNVPQ